MKLIDVLRPENIKLPLTGQTKEDVIRELIDMFVETGLLDDADAVFQAVMEREKIMTTGVGKGVAIPHCKKNICKEFSIALGVHPAGVDYQSIDNKPARIIFLLIGPEDNPGMHIRLLSRISRLISKDTVREALLQCKDIEDAYKILSRAEEKFFEIA